MEGLTILLFCTSLLSILPLSTATDTIILSQSIRDGDTIVSVGGTFELGFFSPDNSTKRYLGIWYNKISTRTVVWVANRETPIIDSPGVLEVTNQGILQVLSHNESIIWSTNSSRLVQNPIAKLLESGNLVVKDAKDDNPENFLWQSFDYPCDTHLPGMKIGKNMVTGMKRYLSSWKSADDPSRGDFTFELDPRGYPQIFVKKGLDELLRFGPWNGLGFNGALIKPHQLCKFSFVINRKEMYFTCEVAINNSIAVRAVINQNGVLENSQWNDPTQSWMTFRAGPTDNCDSYAFCGPHGYCKIGNSPECSCLKGFVPKFPRDWDTSAWSNGCVRKTSLDCLSGDGFIKYSGIRLPDTRNSWFNESMTLEECKRVCLNNCSCMAYANLYIIGKGSGCLLWFGDLIDIREYSEDKQEIYIRMASSDIGMNLSPKLRKLSECLTF
ncbi:hypothetical protein L1049_000427 [Liquidambar formosana]|uniref:Uncharacterized protein n=1 Tax=Liquidambar formosana TaxID=63359 RepID=A0AAP0N8S3_LIQFO